MSVYHLVLITAFVLVAPFWLSSYLTKRWRMPDYSGKVSLVLLTMFAGTAICVFGWHNIRLGIDLRGGVILVYQIMDVAEAAPEDEAGARQAPGRRDDVDMDKLAGSIKRRIDPAGVKEITIRPMGSRQIEIIIPQVEDAEVDRIRAVLAQIGSLEFRIVATTRNPTYATYISRARSLSDRRTELRQPADEKETDENATGERVALWVPVKEGKEQERFAADPTLATREITRREGNEFQVLVIDDPYDVTGDYLVRAKPGVDQRMRPAVDFFFNATGAQRFGSLTGTHLPDDQDDYHYLLGIVLDGKLQSAPQIRSTIFGTGIIEGDFTREEVDNLVNVLNSGALDRALSPEPISQQYVGPTLGADTVWRGTTSLAISLVLVFAFVLVYYRFAGVVASFALLLNAILLLAMMITIRAAFTLPGLAGFALTIAMAVDANVLIFERMREESARGAALRMSIRNGFDRALSAIIDSNLTTLITAVVLYVIGTDQVRGFAVTLFLGIVISMYTAIFVTHVIFDVAERQRWLTRLSMMRAIGETHINFLRHKWLMIGISVVVIIIGLAGVVDRWRGFLDIDFTGGVSVQVIFDQQHDIGDVREKLEDKKVEGAGLPDVVVFDVSSRELEKGFQFIVNTSTPEGAEAEEHLVKVKQVLIGLFGGGLSRNRMKVDNVAPWEPQTPQGAAPAAKPVQPAAGEQGRLGHPPGSRAEVAALSSMLLAQAPAAPAGPVAAKPADAPPAKAAAGGPASAQAGVKATLSFDQKISHGALEALFKKAIPTVMKDYTPHLDLYTPGYKEGLATPFKEWIVEIGLPQDRAEKVFEKVKESLAEEPFFPQSNTIGGAVAKITRLRAVYALLASALFILLYLWIRFQRITYGLGAIVSLVHDVLIALGFVAISYYLAKIPLFGNLLLIEPFKVNLTIVTALLTVAGYSLNDTIVIFDRIREVRGKAPVVTQDMLNLSINQTLGRTLLTGVTSIMVIITLYILGGSTIHGFAYAMVIGVITGTYSSIYIASPFLLWVSAKTERRERR